MEHNLGFTVGEYQVLEQLHQSAASTIYRAQRTSDGQPVILKLLSPDLATPDCMARYQQEYTITADLHDEGIIRTYGLVPYKQSLALILEDFDGRSLAYWLHHRSLSLVEQLVLAIRISEILGRIHAAAVIHKDINPANILWNPSTDQLTIIDFGLATRLPEEPPSLESAPDAAGTLAYMSPEQTRRMNRALDYRTDFYSLGITFYELLTGQLPFAASDALEWVHCHIAREVPPPHAVNPEIPGAVSEIVLKLVAKAAEDRYQSAYGLAADLRNCLGQLQSTGTIVPFPLGHADIADKLQVSHKLYGRSQELQTLLAAFDRVSAGSAALLLVAGYSGIGKTALIQEIHKPIVARRGSLIAGKFDQFQRDIPYSALVLALQQLIQQVLTESAERLAMWRERLRAALGSNGQVIAEVIPLSERLIGPQAALPPLGPAETQNRFNLVFQQFIGVFCTSDHPLVIVLDDLQWADLASLKLIDLLLADSATRYLLVIGAYRDNEVDPTHPLELTLERLHKRGLAINQVRLGPLSATDTNQLIADSLRAAPPTTASLSQLVLEKTAGNPFFVNEFLKALAGEGLLTFDRAQVRWQWDVAQITAQASTDNVVDLLIGQLEKLPQAARSALQLAACIGNLFELQTLATVSAQPAQIVLHDLEVALQAGFVQPAAGSASGTPRYRFRHDRIQQAAYALIAPPARPAVHVRIGRLWLGQEPEPESPDVLFGIVNQLNVGLDLISDTSERARVAELNRRAGQKARASLAYAAAVKYYALGIELLAADYWERQYELAFALHRGQAECAYLSGQLDLAEALFEILLAHTRSRLDQAEIYNLRIILYTNLGKFAEAIAVGYAGLALFGLVLPETAAEQQAAVGAAFAEAQLLRQQRSIDALLDAPLLRDPEQLAIITLLMNMSPSAYFINQDLFALVVMRMVMLSLREGHAAVSAFSYVIYAVLLVAALEQYAEAYAFGQLALRLNDRLTAIDLTPRLYYLFGAISSYWRESLAASIGYCRQAYQVGVTVGDFIHASYGCSQIIYYRCLKGDALDEVAAERRIYQTFVERTENNLMIASMGVVRHFLESLQGQNSAAETGSAADLQHASLLEDLQRPGLTVILNLHLTLQLQVLFLYGAYPAALLVAREGEQTAAAAAGQYWLTDRVFYTALTLAALYPGAPPEEQASALAELDAHAARFKAWAEIYPVNFLQRSELIAAERARVVGDRLAAIDAYDRAISAAREHEFTNIEAIANELAARFYLACGQPHFARHYLGAARHGYARWGVQRKVALLDTEFPELRRQRGRDSSDRTSTTDESGPNIDILTVVRASQAISSEIALDTLLVRLMHILIENAGAQKGVLLLEEHNALWVMAAGDVGAESVRVFQATPLESDPTISAAIINYVYRTHEIVVLDDAAQDKRFASDSYIQTYRPRSVICAPIRKQSKLLGLLYLENNLASHAFTPDRVQILEILAAQAATSLENARIYVELEQRVKERTAELEIAREAAEAASRAKSVFLTNMSHEIRTPMNAVLGFAQLMQRDSALPPSHHENLNMIMRSGEHLLALINDVLEMSKIESGRITLAHNSFDFYRMLGDIEEMFRLRAEHKGLNLVIDCAPDVPQYLETDERKLRQVIINLLGNAIKFTPDGQVALRIGVVSHSAATVRLVFMVEDTGMGIAPDELDQLFQPFVQTASGRQIREGTGLGLPISRQFVWLMGGDISVASRPIQGEGANGHGSTFTFEIAAQLAQATMSAAAAPGLQVIGLEPGQPDYRLLVVDDNAENRTLLHRLLEEVGFAVRDATNGQEALDIYQQWRPQLIWMDMQMPVLDGYAATQQIKTTLQGQATVVIALTASVLDEERAVVLSAGCDDYLPKPFHLPDIFALLQKYLGVRYHYAQPASTPPMPLEMQPLTPALLMPLPAMLLEALRQGIMQLDIDQIDLAIDRIRAHSGMLSESLAALVRDFKYDTIMDLIQAAGDGNQVK